MIMERLGCHWCGKYRLRKFFTVKMSRTPFDKRGKWICDDCAKKEGIDVTEYKKLNDTDC